MNAMRTLSLAVLPMLAFATMASAADANRPGVPGQQAIRAHLISATTPGGKELVPNASRAYPASCFSDTQPSATGNVEPLPVTPTGPTYGGTVTLYAYINNSTVSNHDSTENVTITIWRVPCSSSGDKLSYNPDGGAVAATLFRIQRSAANDTHTDVYPTFPAVRISQNGIAFDDATFRDYVRTASEPNTVLADTLIDAPVVDSTTYVLENYPYSDATLFAFNQAFQIRFDNGYADNAGNPTGQVIFNVPDYAPSASTYPAASQPMPINGYHTGSWYDATHSGEGILTQVYDIDGHSRIFAATWYTFDSAGIPFWLVASGTFTIGTTQLTNIPVSYRTGGGFAGNFTAPIPQTSWGTMSVQFPDCQHMTFSYNGNTSTVNGGPQGSGTKTFTRLGSVNSLSCQ